MVDLRHVSSQDLSNLQDVLAALKKRIELLSKAEEQETGCFANLLLRVLLALARSEVHEAFAYYAEMLQGLTGSGPSEGLDFDDLHGSEAEPPGDKAEEELRAQEAKIVQGVLQFLIPEAAFRS